MPKRELSAAHKAKIAAGVRAYHACCRTAKTSTRARPKPTPKPKPRPATKKKRRAVLTQAARPATTKFAAAGARKRTQGQQRYDTALARIAAKYTNARDINKGLAFTT